MPRPRKPLEILKLEGTYRKDRHGDRQGNVFSTDEIECPFDPKKEVVAWREWHRLAEPLRTLGLLTSASYQAFVCYCNLIQQKVHADMDITERGVILELPITNKEGDVVGTKTVKNPSVKVSNDCARLIRSFLGEFGCTPSTLARVSVKKDAPAVSAFKKKYLSGGARVIQFKPKTSE